MNFAASLFEKTIYNLYSKNEKPVPSPKRIDQRHDDKNLCTRSKCEDVKNGPLPLLFPKKQQKTRVPKKVHL